MARVGARPSTADVTTWYVPPEHPLYDWYRAAVPILHMQRVLYLESNACPNCKAVGSITVSTRSIKCSQCSLAIDFRPLTVRSPKDQAAELQKKRDTLTRLLLQLKYEANYKGIDHSKQYKVLSAMYQDAVKQQEDLETVFKGRDVVILTPKE